MLGIGVKVRVEPPPAEGIRVGAAGCCSGAHPRLSIASLHGPSETENGLYKDDMFADVLSVQCKNLYCVTPRWMRLSNRTETTQSRYHRKTTPGRGGVELININIEVTQRAEPLVSFEYFIYLSAT